MLLKRDDESTSCKVGVAVWAATGVRRRRRELVGMRAAGYLTSVLSAPSPSPVPTYFLHTVEGSWIIAVRPNPQTAPPPSPSPSPPSPLILQIRYSFYSSAGFSSTVLFSSVCFMSYMGSLKTSFVG